MAVPTSPLTESHRLCIEDECSAPATEEYFEKRRVESNNAANGPADLQTRRIYEAFDVEKDRKLSARQTWRKFIAERRPSDEECVEIDDEKLGLQGLMKKYSTTRRFDLTSSVKDTAIHRRLNWNAEIRYLLKSLDELETHIKDLDKQERPDPREFQLLQNGFWPHYQRAERLRVYILEVWDKSERGEHEMEAHEIERYRHRQKDVVQRIYRIYGDLDEVKDAAKRAGRFRPRRE